MKSLAVFFSARGRLAPRAFAAGAAVVYGTAFLSPFLISPPVLLRAGLAPFAVVQAIAIWCWFCLHAKRLRDADRQVGVAVAIAVLYALAVILFLLLVALIMPFGDVAQRARAEDVPVLPLLIATLTAETGIFAYVAAAILALVVAPVPVAIGFSIWAATRPAATSSARS
jgi:uncharacterized membrane protein YhaH (DUF805 family)